MRCEDRKDLILLYAAGQLDGPEATELRAHLASGCPQCAGALAEAEAVMGALASSLPPVAPRADLADRLMNRVRATTTNQPPRRKTSWWAMAGTAALAASIGALITANFLWMPDHQKARLVDSADIRTVSLSGGAGDSAAHGRVFWDMKTHMWSVYVFDLKPPAGHEAELWFITADKKKMPGGMIKVDANGNGSMTTPMPAKPIEVVATAVTYEPMGGSTTPTMPIRLIGEVK